MEGKLTFHYIAANDSSETGRGAARRLWPAPREGRPTSGGASILIHKNMKPSRASYCQVVAPYDLGPDDQSGSWWSCGGRRRICRWWWCGTRYLQNIYRVSTLGAAPPVPPRQRLLQQVCQTRACGQVGSGVTAADNQQYIEIVLPESSDDN